jgi:prevent-host-death family protein
MVEVDLKDAQQDLAKLIEQVAAGDEVVITRDHQPIVKIVAVKPRQRTFGSAQGMIQIADDFDAPLEDFDEYR